MKKIITLSLSLLLLCTLIVPALANEVTEEVESTTVTQFYYIVYNKDGTVRETGTTPDFNMRADWGGITLSNGQSMKFLQDGLPFRIQDGTRATFSVSLNRAASMYNLLTKSTAYGQFISYYDSFRTSGPTFYHSLIINDAGYYYYETTNVSSDPVTITSASFTFGG